MADAGQPQWLEGARMIRAERLEDQADVVSAGVEQRDPPPDESVGKSVEERSAADRFAPCAVRELVHPVPAASAEELRHVEIHVREEMNREVLRAESDPEGVIGLRETDDESWRIEARLGLEADQTAGSLGSLDPPGSRDGGHDRHRGVEAGEEIVEGAGHEEPFCRPRGPAEGADRRVARPVRSATSPMALVARARSGPPERGAEA